LGKVYDKLGRPSDAVRATDLAIDLAVRENDLSDARELRDDRTRYQSELDHTLN
jgi:hypothetical protein